MNKETYKKIVLKIKHTKMKFNITKEKNGISFLVGKKTKTIIASSITLYLKHRGYNISEQDDITIFSKDGKSYELIVKPVKDKFKITFTKIKKGGKK